MELVNLVNLRTGKTIDPKDYTEADKLMVKAHQIILEKENNKIIEEMNKGNNTSK